MKCVFELSEIRKSSPSVVSWEVLRQEEVDTYGRTPEEMRSRLRMWALGVLASGRYDIGLYCAGAGQLDEDGYSTNEYCETMIAWDGEKELTTSS
ncbi:hypothetical protein [Thermasporomyces composti]|jgi:hypothetical protein|uniref:Uncharacterized protein n=1 Tax=Thermasporomyces composti TaxID=696763 RepID=A0A3D9V0A6_THECX|nr:hypothetical protein [Thermasporomyces composti]REF34856.1 hypothetical protein DFJ64_0222 [Thermasporomyces composti]